MIDFSIIKVIFPANLILICGFVMALAKVCHTMQIFMFLPCPLDSGYLKGSIPFLFISLFPVMHMGTW